MARLKLPRNSTPLTLYQHSIYPTEKCPLSQECSNGEHHSSQGAPLSLWWRYEVQRKALCPNKGPSELFPEGVPEWEESHVLRARLKHCRGAPTFLSHGSTIGWQTSGGRGLAFLALLICLLTGHLKGFMVETWELLFLWPHSESEAFLQWTSHLSSNLYPSSSLHRPRTLIQMWLRCPVTDISVFYNAFIGARATESWALYWSAWKSLYAPAFPKQTEHPPQWCPVYCSRQKLP